jgi:hypothetical protein
MPLIRGAVVWLLIAHAAVACPFCGPVGRSLAERRDAADSVLVGDAAGDATRAADGLLVQPLAPLAVLRGAADVPAAALECRVGEPIMGTGILFGSRDPDGLRWEAIAADEALIAHVAAAPAVEDPAAQRLRWFAGRLEHANPAIAADAFTEFGLAPFAVVREVADAFDPDQLRAWLADPGVDRRRRGFYALALGVATAATERPSDRSAGIAALHAAVEEAGDDLRAGYDGILAGVLGAETEAGLAYLRGRGLFATDTRPGDAKHALAALRFAWECLADSIPRDRVAEATAGLLDNPAVAADAAIDLARYARWDEVDRVAALWKSLGRDDPLVRRAVAGYLEACPLPAARVHRETLAAADSEAWAAARAAAAGPAR